MTAYWIYTHYASYTFEAKCSNCGYRERVCDDLERKNCPKCKAKMVSQDMIKKSLQSDRNERGLNK